MTNKPVKLLDIIAQLTACIKAEDHEGMKPVCEQINEIEMPDEEKRIYFAMFQEIGGVTQALTILKQFNG